MNRLFYEVLEMRYGTLGAVELAEDGVADTVVRQVWDLLSVNKLNL